MRDVLRSSVYIVTTDWQPGTSYWFFHFDPRKEVICVLEDSVFFGFFFFLCFWGKREPSAGRTRNARGVEREKKSFQLYLMFVP